MRKTERGLRLSSPQIVRCPYITGLCNKALAAIMEQKSGSKRLKANWRASWQGGDQTYISVPNALMTQNAEDKAYLHKGSRIYFIAWEMFFPNVVSRVWGADKVTVHACQQCRVECSSAGGQGILLAVLHGHHDQLDACRC